MVIGRTFDAVISNFFYLAVSEISYIKWLKFPFFNILILIFLADK